MKTVDLFRWGVPALVLVALVYMDMPFPIALVFSAIPFLVISWGINKHRTDRHDFYKISRNSSVMFVVLPAVALILIGSLANSRLGSVLGLASAGLGIWLVMRLNRKIDVSDPVEIHRRNQQQSHELSAIHMREDRLERDARAARLAQEKADSEAAIARQIAEVKARVEGRSKVS